MPEKRKRVEYSKNNGKGVKKSKSDYLSIFVKDPGNESSSDDSDDDGGGAGSFAAFDLPSYGNALNDSEESEGEETTTGKSSDDVIVISDTRESRPGTSKPKPTQAPTNSEIIFVSDPSKLPKPLSFSTPTVMNPVVIDQTGKPGAKAAPVILMNQQVGKSKVPHVQPVIVTQHQPQTAIKTSPQLKQSASKSVSGKQFDTHVAVPMSAMGKQSKVGTVQVVSPPTNKQLPPNQRVPVNQRANGSRPMNVNQLLNKNQQVNVNQRHVANRNVNMAANVRQQINSNQRGSVGQPGQGKGKAPIANVLANAAASAVAAGMSASSIMQQVAQAAQAAAKNTVRPVAMSTPKKPLLDNLPGKNMNYKMSPIIQNSPANQRMQQPGIRVNQNGTVRYGSTARNNVPAMRGGRQQVVRPMVPASSRNGAVEGEPNWKPYSSTLTNISRKMEPASARKLGLIAGNQPNLKQMYSMLRLKFSTKQIYDMCLWDMEHASASLMEIAISNAFS